MFDFLSNLFSGAGAAGAAAGPLDLGALAQQPPSLFSFDPNAKAMFDPAQGKVIGMPGATPPPMPRPNPMAQPYGGPEMPPLARGGGSSAPAEPAYGGPELPPMARMPGPAATAATNGQGFRDQPPMAQTGNPLIDFINSKYRTGGTF